MNQYTLQNSLNKVFSVLGEVFKVPTDSAYCQAKQKVKPEVFVHLTEQLNADFYRLYGADEEVKLWRGHRLMGGDGTKLNLPDTPDLRASFGVQTNQQSECVQATAVVAYDLLNDVGLQSALGEAHSSEKSLLFEVWSALEKGGRVVGLGSQFCGLLHHRQSQPGRAGSDHSLSAFIIFSSRGILGEPRSRANRKTQSIAMFKDEKVCQRAWFSGRN